MYRYSVFEISGFRRHYLYPHQLGFVDGSATTTDNDEANRIAKEYLSQGLIVLMKKRERMSRWD
jgi:hypothetical protein